MPRPQFMPVKLRSGYYARNVGPLTLPEAREVCRVAQLAPEMLDLLREAHTALNWQGAEYLAKRIATTIRKATSEEI